MKKNHLFSFLLSAAFISVFIPSVKAQSGIDFGDVEIGSSVQKTFTIRNKGTIAETGMDIKVGAPFYIDSPATRFAILPGDSITIFISFKPTQVGEIGFTVSLYTSSAGWTPSMQLTGNGIEKSGVKETGLNSSNLFYCYPNPATEAANIEYTLSDRSSVKIEILNLIGESIYVFCSDMENPGVHNVHVDTRLFTAGSYLVRFTLGSIQCVKQLEIVR